MTTLHTEDGLSYFVKIILNCIHLCQFASDKSRYQTSLITVAVLYKTQGQETEAKCSRRRVLGAKMRSRAHLSRRGWINRKRSYTEAHYIIQYFAVFLPAVTRKCADLECKIAHCCLIKNGSFRMISWEIIIFCSASKQSPALSHCKQCFCWVPEPRAAFSPPRENAFD